MLSLRFLRGRWSEVASVAGAAFVMGVIATLAVIGMRTERAVAPGMIATDPPILAEAPTITPLPFDAPSAVDVAAAAVTLETSAFDAAPDEPVPAASIAVENPSPLQPLAAAVDPLTVDTPSDAAALAPPPGEASAAAPSASLEASEAATEAGATETAAAAALSTEAAPTPETPAPTSPAEAELIEVAQKLLAAQGYNPGPADGAAGARTLSAAAAFAAQHDLEDSNIDAAYLAALRAAATGTLPVKSPEADAVITRVTRVREIQALLGSLGYEVGRPDGDPGPQTLRAADAFAADFDLVDAHLDAAFLALLREGAAQR